MLKLLVGLILIGIIVMILPAILTGVSFMWAIAWPILVIILLLIGIAIWMENTKALNAFLREAKSKGLTRKDATKYALYTYKQYPNQLNAKQLQQLTSDLDVYVGSMKDKTNPMAIDVDKRYADLKVHNAKILLWMAAIFAFIFLMAFISVQHA